MPITLKSINAELAKRDFKALLARGDGYYYFRDGEAADWLDTTVRVPTLSSLALAQWLEEFERLKKVNQEIMLGQKGGATKKPSRSKRSDQP
jgi:hypothetical protein